MESRRQHTARGTRWTTRVAAFCPAVAVLLAALAICLEVTAHGQSAPATASMTTVSAAAVPAGTPAGHHGTTAAHSTDCLPGDACCRLAAEGLRAVLATPAQPLPAVLSRMPGLPLLPDTASRSPGAAPACHAPDLHVLQVQRT
ncbi:hypothetical protein ACFPH6_24600 [Streptomyces xiangluensis]|uniref:Secreted protein n=1 Tax=Streptomyces xiangluensis TaxID=2665720 RepID=A0ABV8YWX9_9ACTN